MAMKRIVTEKQAKENVLDLLHRKLARDNIMGKSPTELIARIRKIEDA